MRSLDLRGSSLCFCQDSSPASWLITWWYPRLLIGSFCQQMTPRRMATRRKSRQPDTARLTITSEKKNEKASVVAQSLRLVFIFKKYSPVSLPSEGTWHSLSRSSEIESFVILTKSSRGQSREQPGNCRGYGSTLLSFLYNIDTEAELHRHKDRKERS